MSTAKIPIRYIGPHSAVVVPMPGGVSLKARRGETVECPKPTADELLKDQPQNWAQSSKAGSKKEDE